MSTTLSVCVITYNHVTYIRQAIEGVLSQKVNFPFEIIIADDCSTDGTREILIDFEQRHPGLIRLILQEKNVGPARNWVDLITAPASKYIAYLEGDDYWTDENKLQKQVDLLEQHPDHSFCFHQALRISESASTFDVYPQNNIRSFNAADFFQMVTIPMGSIVYRQEIPIQVIKTHSHGDFLMLCSLLSWGRAMFIKEVMSVYRVHTSGVSYTHASLPYMQRRINELFIEAQLTSLSTDVRKEIGRIYMEHTINMFRVYNNQIPRKEIFKYAGKFWTLKANSTRKYLSQLLNFLF